MEKATWLEVALVVDGELAEAVAEVLARFAPNGVVIESTAVTADAEDAEGHAVGPLRVSAYLPMDAQLEDTRRRLEESLWYLGRIRELPPAQFRPIQETNWAETWKQHYQPILIGQWLVIVPAWLKSPAPERVNIRIEPGMGFGTGTHPTTQLCLELLETCFAAEPPAEVIDVGCGSGILAIAALKLGAQRALGVDIDPEAVTSAVENAELNQVTDRLTLREGSLAEVLQGDFNIRQAPVVLANILALVLIRLLGEGLGQLMTPGGALILSGILEEQAQAVIAAAEAQGLKLADRRQILDWVALKFNQK